MANDTVDFAKNVKLSDYNYVLGWRLTGTFVSRFQLCVCFDLICVISENAFSYK